MPALLLLLALPALLLAQPQPDLQPKPLALTRVTVIDATGAEAKPDMTVVVREGRIAALGRTGKVPIPKGAQVIDAGGKFLIPGLWDMHVHTWMFEIEAPLLLPAEQALAREAAQSWNQEIFFPLWIAHGVTGVRDMGGDLELIKQWRREMAAGRLLGPQITAAGPFVDGPQPVKPTYTITVADEAEARRAVNALKQRGVDLIKVYESVPRQAYFALADEANKLGIPFAGHVPLSVSAAEASDAGQKSIEHTEGVLLACSRIEAPLRKALQGMPVDLTELGADRAAAQQGLNPYALALATYSDEKAAALCARFVKNRTWQVPTLTSVRSVASLGESSFTRDERLKFIPPQIKKFWLPHSYHLTQGWTAEDFSVQQQFYQKSLELVRAMRRAGVEFLAGTDTLGSPYCFPGSSLHDELALLVKAGLTPLEALQSATRNPARYLSRLDTQGTIEVGKTADLVLLEANPLIDISHTKRIAAVIIGGRLIDRARLQAMLAKSDAAAGQKRD